MVSLRHRFLNTLPFQGYMPDIINLKDCLVATRYSGFGTRDLDALCLKSSKMPTIAFQIPNPD
jgi:hypothetical protein